MTLAKIVVQKGELRDYNIFKEQVVLKNVIKSEFDFKLEIYTNYKEQFVYHYIGKELVKVEVFKLEENDL